jgi:hypothetical protein
MAPVVDMLVSATASHRQIKQQGRCLAAARPCNKGKNGCLLNSLYKPGAAQALDADA